MIQIIFLGLITLLGLFGLSKMEKIGKLQLIIISIGTILLLGIFTIFENQNDIYKEKVTKINLDFGQGKSILCKDINISNKTFNITSNSFVAKQDSKYVGTIIAFENCF